MRTTLLQVAPGSIRLVVCLSAAAVPAITAALLVITAAFMVTTAGCGKPARRGGSLSGAATEASKPEEEQKTVVQRDPEKIAYADTALATSAYTDEPTVTAAPILADTTKDDTKGTGVGMFGTASRIAGDAPDRFGGMGLELSFGRNRRAGFGVRGYATSGNLSDRGLVSTGLTNESEFAAEVFFRYKLSRAHTFMSVYPAAGLRWSILLWDYTNPVDVSDGGEVREVGSDYLKSFSAFAAIGAVFLQGERFQPEVEFQIGYKFYQDTTGEGFANDVFDDSAFFQLLVGVVVRIGPSY